MIARIGDGLILTESVQHDEEVRKSAIKFVS